MRAINATEGHTATGLWFEKFGQFEDPAVQDAVMPADLIIFQRNLFAEPMFSAVEYFQGLGKPVILDLDDAYPILPWSNPAHLFWIQNARNLNPPPLKGLEIGVQLVDAVSSPSKVICADWEHLNTPLWIPNFPQGSWYEDLPGKPEQFNDRIIIGWGGSVSHYDSYWFSGVRDALGRICQRHPEVIFKVCGNDGRIFFQLPVQGMRQKMWQRGVPPSEWPKIVSTFDIGLAPLDLLHPYDARRSWIKGIEYILAGVPWVFSDGPPYAELGKFGHPVSNTPEQWEERIEYVIANLDGEKEKMKVARQETLGLTMERNVGFFEQMVGKMAGLRVANMGLPGIINVTVPIRPITELEGLIHVQ